MIRILFKLLIICWSASALALPINVTDSWIREAPPNAVANAGYMKIHNKSGEQVTISHITSKNFARIELHQTIELNGMARMRPVKELIIEANQSVNFEPGGLHLMLMEARKHATEGDLYELILHFSNGLSIPVKALVKRDAPANKSAHHHHHH